MIKSNNINAAQVALVAKIASGDVKLPETHLELSELVTKALLTKDHDTEERETMDKCKTQCLRTIAQLSLHGEVYISAVKAQLNRRNYFKDLVIAKSNRGEKAMLSILGELAQDGCIKVIGFRVVLIKT